MKIKTILILFSLMCLLARNLAAVDLSEYSRLLSTYASENGVDYVTWVQSEEDVAALDDVLNHWASAKVDTYSKNSQKAFYINLYNASMIQAVLKNYPIKSVKDIGKVQFSIFKKNFIKLGGKKLSLDGVEKGILLKVYGDERIHFAVNCASESCPPLRVEPFKGEILDKQLDEQTVLFADSDRAAQIDTKKRVIFYSELLKWYDADFKGDHPAVYLNQYRTKTLPKGYKVDWISYDWALNQIK